MSVTVSTSVAGKRCNSPTFRLQRVTLLKADLLSDNFEGRFTCQRTFSRMSAHITCTRVCMRVFELFSA